MSKASRSQAIDPALMKLVAERIYSRMRKLGLTQTALSEKCSIQGAHLTENEPPPSLGRERISKILMNRHERPNENAARSMSQGEFRALARVLKVSVEWLCGDGLDEDGVIWNVLAEPHRGAHLLHLFEEHEDRADDSIVWSEYPLCSFMSLEFMAAFHQAHFADVDTLGVTKDRTSLVDFFNKAGNARRQRILRPGRPFELVNLVYRSEVERIARGEGVYRSISPRLRKRNFEHLIRVSSDRALKMEFVIVDDEKVARLERPLRDYETVGVIGKILSIWNYHSGSIGWTEHSRRIQHHRNLLIEMKKAAYCKSLPETIEYVKQIADGL